MKVGTGQPIVLVHGTPYSSQIFESIVSALAEHHEVFLFDHLGYGRSEQHAGQDLSIATQARRFARLLDHWGPQRAERGGHRHEARHTRGDRRARRGARGVGRMGP